MTGLIHLFVLQVVIQGVLRQLKPRYANLFNHCYNKNVTVSASKILLYQHVEFCCNNM
jgi:hypothetical protein